jgi:hypothetical protein
MPSGARAATFGDRRGSAVRVAPVFRKHGASAHDGLSNIASASDERHRTLANRWDRRGRSGMESRRRLGSQKRHVQMRIVSVSACTSAGAVGARATAGRVPPSSPRPRPPPITLACPAMRPQRRRSQVAEDHDPPPGPPRPTGRKGWGWFGGICRACTRQGRCGTSEASTTTRVRARGRPRSSTPGCHGRAGERGCWSSPRASMLRAMWKGTSEESSDSRGNRAAMLGNEQRHLRSHPGSLEFKLQALRNRIAGTVRPSKDGAAQPCELTRATERLMENLPFFGE